VQGGREALRHPYQAGECPIAPVARGYFKVNPDDGSIFAQFGNRAVVGAHWEYG
jgi:hypothetical protein